MALNTTINGLVLSSISRSPLITVPRTKLLSSFALAHSHLNRFTSNLFRSQSSSLSASFYHSKVSNFLTSSIYINQDTKEPDFFRENLDQRVGNLSPMSNVSFKEMTFYNCKSDLDGGAAFIIFKNLVYCNFTSFTNCYAPHKGGALLVVAGATNFTQACFYNCSSYKGQAVYTPKTLENYSIEGCTIASSVGVQYEGDISSCGFYIVSPNLVARDNNFTFCTNSNCPGLVVNTAHDLQLTRLTLYQCVQDADTTETTAIVSIMGITMQQNINFTNFIECEAKSGSILFCDIDYLTVFKFSFNNCVMHNPDAPIIMSDTAIGTQLHINNCTFDKAETELKFLPPALINLTHNEFAIETYQNLKYVTTKGCWGHSHYKWSTPEGPWINMCIAFVVISLAASFGYVCFHKWRLNKKEEEAQASIIDELNPESQQSII